MRARTFRAVLLASATVVTSMAAPQAFAQTSDEEINQRDAIGDIVVTARRRVESLQDTPIAVTAVSSAIMEERGIQSFVDISQITPNLKVHATPGGMGAAAVAMRGISSADNVIGNDAPFGFYIDGVPYGRISTAAMDIVEPQSVQVLRGPQGTLFGRNTTGGAIVVETHTPTDDMSGVVRASYGSFDAYSLRARLDTGLIGGSNIKASFAYQRRERDGIQDNVGVPDRLDPGSEKADAYWGKIQGEWGNFKAVVTADYTKMGGIPPMIQLVTGTPAFLQYLENSVNFGGNKIPVTNDPLFRIENYSTPLPQRIVQKGVAVTLEYAINDHLTAKAIGALRAYRRDDTNNYGASDIRGPITAGGIGSFPGWYGFTERFQKQSQKTMEVQLLGDYEEFNFVLGGFYFDEDARDFGTTRLPFVINPNLAADTTTYRDYSVHSKSKAGFAQVDWRPGFLGGDLEFTAGIRYTDDSRAFTQVLPLVRALDLKGNNWSYVLGANYQVSDNLMAYMKYSTGYRAGGFNARTTTVGLSPEYAPEKIKSWEAGFKLDGWDNRLRLNVAAFYNKYDDLQVTQFAPPTGSAGGGNINTNANAKYKGFEVEATVIPVSGLTLSGSVGYVDSEYSRYPRALLAGGALYPGCSPITSGGTTVAQNCADVTLFQNVPNLQWDVNAQYEFPLQSYGRPALSVNYAWTSKTDGVIMRAASAFPYILDNPSYGLLGARFAVSDIPISGDVVGTVALFGRNLTDKRYGIASIDFGYAGTKNFPDRRTMGVEVKIDF